MPKIKVKGQTVQTGERPQINGRTHTHTHTDATKRIIAPATRSIINIGKQLMSVNRRTSGIRTVGKYVR